MGEIPRDTVARIAVASGLFGGLPILLFCLLASVLKVPNLPEFGCESQIFFFQVLE